MESMLTTAAVPGQMTSGQSRDGRIGSKVGQIGRKWDKSGAFSYQISVHLAPRAKCTEIWSEKAPDLSHFGPIWPILEPNLPSLVCSSRHTGTGQGMVRWGERNYQLWPLYRNVKLTPQIKCQCKPCIVSYFRDRFIRIFAVRSR